MRKKTTKRRSPRKTLNIKTRTEVHDVMILAAWEQGYSRPQICEVLGLTDGQVAGFIDRNFGK